MRGKTWTPADVDALKAAHGRGEEIAVTARRMGRSEMSLHQQRSRLGLRSGIRKGGPVWHRRNGSGLVTDARRMAEIDWSGPDLVLAEITGLSVNTVSRMRKRLGVVARRFRRMSL